MENSAKFTINFEFLGLNQVEKAPQAVKAVATAVADLTDLINPLKGIQEQLSGISTKLDTLGQKGQEAGKKIKKAISEGIGESAFNFNNIIAAAQNVAGAIAPIFKEGMARQSAEVQFSTLLGSEEEGKAYAVKLRNSTMATLYGNNTVNDAAKNMLAFGLETKTITPILESIGDIAAGDAQKFGSLSLAFAQISSAGKLQGQDLMQLINAGFNPLQVIAKKTHKTIGQLKDEMSKGAISAKDVEEAFLSATSATGMFYNMAEKIKTDTLQGQMAVMAAAFDDLKAKIFDALLPITSKIVPAITDSLIPALSEVIDFITPLFTFISDNSEDFAFLAETILVLVGALKIWTGAQAVLNAVMNANPISLIIIGITALVYLVKKATDNWDKWRKSIYEVCPPIAIVLDMVDSLRKSFGSIIDAFSNGGFIAGIKRIGYAIMDLLLAPVQSLLELIAKIPGLEDVAGGMAKDVQNYRKALDIATAPPPTKEEPKEEDTMSDLTKAVNGGTGGDGLQGASLDSAAKTGTDKVAGGGQRNTTINITLNNLVETINFNGSIDENSEDLTSKTQNALLRVLYSAQTAI